MFVSVFFCMCVITKTTAASTMISKERRRKETRTKPIQIKSTRNKKNNNTILCCLQSDSILSAGGARTYCIGIYISYFFICVKFFTLSASIFMIIETTNHTQTWPKIYLYGKINKQANRHPWCYHILIYMFDANRRHFVSNLSKFQLILKLRILQRVFVWYGAVHLHASLSLYLYIVIYFNSTAAAAVAHSKSIKYIINHEM